MKDLGRGTLQGRTRFAANDQKRLARKRQERIDQAGKRPKTIAKRNLLRTGPPAEQTPELVETPRTDQVESCRAQRFANPGRIKSPRPFGRLIRMPLAGRLRPGARRVAAESKRTQCPPGGSKSKMPCKALSSASCLWNNREPTTVSIRSSCQRWQAAAVNCPCSIRTLSRPPKRCCKTGMQSGSSSTSSNRSR